ncbi:type II CRISPR RNA-guided endonuclease Cas9 [Vagococcus xieshaowenii]|uniref:CRISPR-associated endonuclease Cas9 n=1 Tax=Vagococcus xieshaowenii TaxID=2562451 RepID=A0AAJ5JKU4_9ENTE|nr:type II CRISPR RNA-guided endonuclease Cas9 [Vagococcus xieshaowenii]QCA28732.1 type II CRISPR RNA-guided endonuclease Cas9 [Vagococcus xieshaowenii]TFZ40460.1 type II CRISPR RNA-guided endonuclease Cas9 [Vagococcus xieshaowenii]
MGIIIGLDIGVSSVGYGVINAQSGDIIEAGSRLFPMADADNNKIRRESRGARRLKNRRTYRLTRAKRLLEKNGFPIGKEIINIYSVRTKALTEQISKDELSASLIHLCKRRGVSYLDDLADDKEVSNEAINENKRLLEGYFPCEIQLARLSKFGATRGTIIKDNHAYENIFPTSAYVNEAKEILKTQKAFYDEISDEFINEYISILSNRREYFDGPGSETSRTDYGRYKVNGETLNNLFEVLIGKCTVYPNELRGARISYTAQEFDLLNELNNLSVNDEKLTETQKKQIIKQIKNEKAPKVMNIISKITGESKELITGFIVKDDKPMFHNFKTYRDMQKFFDEEIIVDNLSREELDTLGYILTLNTEASGIKRDIADKLPIFNDKQIELIISFRKKYSKDIKGWHSLSLLAMNEMIADMYIEPKNQMQILAERGFFKKNIEKYKSYKYLPTKMISEEILNPVVRRSVNQSLKIINQLLKNYGEIEKIVIEMPRETNLADQKKAQEQAQKNNREEKRKAIDLAKAEYGCDDSVFHGHKDLDTKLRLWYQQGGKCLYSGKIIKISELVNNPNQFEIDHVIPLSVSFDDGLNNKVLSYRSENKVKGQRTPWQYLSGSSRRNFEDFRNDIEKLYNKKKITLSKRKNLLMMEDINKWEVRQGFINRNLVDTRYASKTVLNELQKFFKAHGNNTQVSIVRGKYTSTLRRKWRINKDRDESYAHHAIDALIVASVPQQKIWQNKFSSLQENNTNSDATEEKLYLEKMDKKVYGELAYGNPYPNFFDNVKAYEPYVKYSHRVDTKYNRKISDATIYSTREVENAKGKKEIKTIGKIKNIYDVNIYKKDFLPKYKKDKTQFLMYHHDPKTFELMEKIMDQYSDMDNPFAAYQQEYGEIKKYSKKGNGPVIKDIKYYNKKVNECVDITPSNSSKKVVLLSTNPYRSDVYYNHQKGVYEILGIKYKDIQFLKGGKYGFKDGVYEELRIKEGIGENSEFVFSLYKNDIIRITDTENGETNIFRFLSRTMPQKRGYVELKPYHKALFEKGDDTGLEKLGKSAGRQLLKGISKENLVIEKLRTDILGNIYHVKKEDLSLIF